MADHLATVGTIYEAFGRGDIPAILAELAEDVQWEHWADSTYRAQAPWLAPRDGKAGAMEFFQIVGAMTFTQFEVRSLMAGGNQVAAEIVVTAQLPESGVTLQDEEMHLWTFNEEGKVARLRHYADTAKHIAAAGQR